MATAVSSIASSPYFNRAWSIAVDTADGNHYVVRSLVGKGEEPLHVRFKIDTYALLAYWTAEVEIYNMSSQTASQLQSNPNLGGFWKFNQPLVAGDSVAISGGYQSSTSGVSFDSNANKLYEGQVLQSVWTRENVVDFKLILRCVTGLLQDALNFTSFTLAKGATAFDAVNQICDQSQIQKENIDSASQTALSQSKFSRGQTVHGRPYEIIRQVVKQNNLWSWVSPNGLNIRSFDPRNPPESPDYAYGPPSLPSNYTTGGTQQGLVKKTLIGTPQQTQDGVTFRVLLDNNVKIGDAVQLAPGTVINPFPVQIGALPPVPSRNGLYVVAGVRHVGDSRGRGGDWFTEITALTMDFFANFLQSQSIG